MDKYLKIALIFLLTTLVAGCMKPKTDPVTGKKILIENDLKKRAIERAEKGGGIFDSTKGLGGGQTTYEFATSNVLWRASLDTLNFVPITSANYSGGLLITDWYSSNTNSKESIKIQIRFLSNVLASTSIEVTSYKKVCAADNNCKVSKLDNSFNNEIQNSILQSARKLELKKRAEE